MTPAVLSLAQDLPSTRSCHGPWVPPRPAAPPAVGGVRRRLSAPWVSHVGALRWAPSGGVTTASQGCLSSNWQTTPWTEEGAGEGGRGGFGQCSQLSPQVPGGPGSCGLAPRPLPPPAVAPQGPSPRGSPHSPLLMPKANSGPPPNPPPWVPEMQADRPCLSLLPPPRAGWASFQNANLTGPVLAEALPELPSGGTRRPPPISPQLPRPASATLGFLSSPSPGPTGPCSAFRPKLKVDS